MAAGRWKPVEFDVRVADESLVRLRAEHLGDDRPQHWQLLIEGKAGTFMPLLQFTAPGSKGALAVIRAALERFEPMAMMNGWETRWRL